MLRSSVFSEATATVGILVNGFGLCYFIGLFFTPAIYALHLPIFAVFLLIWYFFSIRLLQLGAVCSGVEAQKKLQ